MEGIDAAYINMCVYDPEKAPLCPIFKLGDIIKLSGFNFETIARVVRLVFIWHIFTVQLCTHVHMVCCACVPTGGGHRHCGGLDV